MDLNIDRLNWTKVRLGEVVEWYQKDIPNELQSEKNIEYYITASEIDGDEVSITRYKELSDGQKGPTITKHFEKGDLLLSTRSVALRKAAIAPVSGVTGEKLLVLRCVEGGRLDPKLMPFVFQSAHFWHYAQNSASGSVNKFTSWTKLAKYEFLLPPKDQQAELAELLWANDAYVESNRSMLMKNETLLLTYSKFLFSEGTGTPRSLSNIGELLMGQSPSGSTINENEDGLPFLQGNAEFGDKYPTTKKYTTAPKKIVPSDSILISVRAPVGDLNIADKEYCIGRGLAGLYIEDPVLRNYIYHFLKYARLQLERNSTGSTFKAINKATLSELKCFIPDRINLINNSNQLNQITKVRDNQKHILKTTQELIKSLINQIF